jgi:Concanavalin A-like lectin/glucanases superfamily
MGLGGTIGTPGPEAGASGGAPGTGGSGGGGGTGGSGGGGGGSGGGGSVGSGGLGGPTTGGDGGPVPDGPSPPADVFNPPPDLPAPEPPRDSGGVPDLPPDAPVVSATPVARFGLDPGQSNAGVTLVDGATWNNQPSPSGAPSNTGSVTVGGGNDHVRLSVAGLPNFAAAKTVAFWYWMEPPLTARRYVVVFASTGNAALEFLVNSGTPVVWIGATTGGQDVVLTQRVKTGWNHLAYTYVSGTSHIYVDGVRVRSSSLVHRTAAVTELLLGTVAPGSTSSENFVGRIDDLRIYDRALADADVKAIFDGAP